MPTISATATFKINPNTSGLLARVGTGGLPEHPTAGAYLDVLRAVGFRGGHAESVDGLREDESTVAGLVRERAAEQLGPRTAEERTALESAEARLRQIERAVADGRLELVQVFAHKPT